MVSLIPVHGIVRRSYCSLRTTLAHILHIKTCYLGTHKSSINIWDDTVMVEYNI